MERVRGVHRADGGAGKDEAMIRCGQWRVWTSEHGPSVEEVPVWIRAVVALIEGGEALHRSKHAATYRWARGNGDVFVKAYHRYRRATVWKDCLRPSKARHVLAVSAHLTRAGFHVPCVLAAAERRRGGCVRQAWIATAALAGTPVAEEVAALAGPAAHGARPAVRAKRSVLTAVGREVARLHQAGFVAGDLVPANVWVVRGASAPGVAFLDHDRTRAHRGPAPWWRARRNLVQLNRVVLPGVGATDRLRVYRAYVDGRRWRASVARRRLGWVVRKTIERRRRFDHAPIPAGASVDFRALMRAGGPFAPAGSVAAPAERAPAGPAMPRCGR